MLSSIARAVLVHTEEESVQMGGEWTGIEHLLLGLLVDSGG